MRCSTVVQQQCMQDGMCAIVCSAHALQIKHARYQKRKIERSCPRLVCRHRACAGKALRALLRQLVSVRRQRDEQGAATADELDGLTDQLQASVTRQ